MSVNFPKLEEEVLAQWEAKEIFKKSLAKPSPRGNFVFFEGPPTANAAPGIHHTLSRYFKDLIPRYKTMQGYHVERKAGWDTQGLPVELQVEKKLGISGKPDIERYGVKEFNAACKKMVWDFLQDWEKTTKRIGFWLDLEHPYVTYDNDYIESLWWIFKQAWDKDLVYLGHKVVPQCPRCGTALSSHEVAQGYQSVKENSVYLKFKVKTGNGQVKAGDYILSWTTTPWTLPGNVALAVGRDFNYLRVKKGNDYYIIAEALAEKVLGSDYELVAQMKGEGLLGLEYEPLFPEALPSQTKNYDRAFKIYPADFVSTEDGTGVVHTAVMYGEDDYNLGEEVGLPKYHTVTENGLFVDSVKPWAGRFVKDKKLEQEIVDDLKSKNFLLKEEEYAHDYPFCWRCDSPLIYYAKNSWFIKMSALKDELVKNNQTINWVPDYIKNGRFGEWLNGIKDWAISRERYWGTPLPIWVCESCGAKKCVGSRQELGQELEDLHRPFIDEVEFDCQCGAKMKRVKEVADCWFDSGSMPFAQYHYPFENKEKIDSGEQYPADYICEAIDQTRGWFYTLLAVATFLGKGVPYKNVICLGHINDAHGKKMSKSKGNMIYPMDVINKFGSDPIRWYMYTLNQPGDYKNFDEKGVDEVVKKVFLILWNVLTFYQMYAKDPVLAEEPSSNHILDQWLISRLNKLIIETTEKLDKYDIIGSARGFNEFINLLSTWYVRRSRDRFKSDDQKEKEEALHTLGYVLLTLTKLMAPYAPFIMDGIYRELNGKLESVHLENWPTYGQVDQKVLDQMDIVRTEVEKGLALRKEAGLKLRQPLASYTGVETKHLKEAYLEILKEELNVKSILNGSENKIDTNLTPELMQEGFYRELVRQINDLRKTSGLTINDRIKLHYQTDDEELKMVFERFADEIKKATLSDEIITGEATGEPIKIGEYKIKIQLIK